MNPNNKKSNNWRKMHNMPLNRRRVKSPKRYRSRPLDPTLTVNYYMTRGIKE